MTSHEHEPKVRPIEYVPDDAPSFGTDSEEAPEHVPWSRRPLLALAVSAAAVLVAVGAVSIFGALEFSDPQPVTSDAFSSGAKDDTPSTDDTVPPPLADSLPYVTDRLTLVALVDGGLQTLIWDPSFRRPNTYDLPIGPVSAGSLAHASFDSGGRTLAVGITTSDGADVYLGQPTDIGDEADLVGVSSMVWHASDVGSLSWIVPAPDNGAELRTGKVNPLSGAITNDVVVTRFGGFVEVVSWDSSGFVVNTDSSVIALDQTGGLTWERKGTATSASASIVATATLDHRAGDTRWQILDRFSGDQSPGAVAGSQSNLWVSTSRETDLVAEVSTSDDSAKLLVYGPGLGHRRAVNIGVAVDPIGFSAQTEYLQFAVRDSNDLVFVNWRTGAVHTVPIPDEFSIVGIDLG